MFLIYCAFVLFSCFIIKLFLHYITAWDDSYTCLVGKTALITGANTGTGFATALEFAKRGAKVILVCRDRKKGETARKRIIEETNNENVSLKLADFLSLTEVRRLAKEINEEEEKLHILVNNAGVANMTKTFTEDGLQPMMQANYFAAFLLTNLLLNKMRESAPSKIINLSSCAAALSTLKVENMNAEPKPTFWSYCMVYAHSKLCLLAFTKTLAKKLNGSGVKVNAVHPGGVATDLFRNFNPVISVFVIPLMKIYLKNPEEGAQTTIHAAASKKVDKISGGYFLQCYQTEMYSNVKSEAFCEALFKKSVELVRLQPWEMQL